MSFEENKEFDQNMNHLVHLLKKMIKSLPHLSQGGMPKFPSKGQGNNDININFFFTFLPVSADDLEEIDDIYEQYLNEEERAENHPDFTPELSASDLDFLRRHGMRF